MLSDILKALELLLKVVQGPDSSDRKKRRELAKWLLRLHLDLEAIVDAGDRLIKLLPAGPHPTDERQRMKFYRRSRDGSDVTDLIRRKQRAIEQAIEHLNEKEMKAILGVLSPTLKPIVFINFYHYKSRVLGLLLSQFTENDESKLMGRLCGDDCANCDAGFATHLEEKYGRQHPHWHLVGKARSSYLTEVNSRAEEIEIIGEEEYLGLYLDCLQRLRQLQEQLRVVLRDEFALEELL